jgi:acetyl-CoA/propionyl-CoA carboxylase biotin carboxyl carrier protein
MKVAYAIGEIPELFASATREAVAAFGRGECFVEQYLDKARHVEAQVIADQHGNVVVAGTRDCSLQRRFQKLVEEAPAPFLTDDQRRRIHESAKAICREAGYYGAGTVEYLVQGDTVSFLEVNTRLQVEHPVTEETAGIDLVRQQFRIANGERLSLTEDPTPRGHAFEFRINGEDPGRDFLPGPGPVHVYREPSGPGVRVDSGVESGSVISGRFDSMLAKLIVTGENRTEALERARRALAEFTIEGLATALPFHRQIVEHPAFTNSENFGVYTKWIETEWENTIPPQTGAAAVPGPGEARQTITVEVDGRRVEVSLPGGLMIGGVADHVSPPSGAPSGEGADAAIDADTVIAPMQGNVVKVAVEDGQKVAEGDLVIVLEAMKMENPVTAHKAGIVTGLAVQPGAFITQGAPIAQLK